MKTSILLILILLTIPSSAQQIKNLKTKADVKVFVQNICSEILSTEEYEGSNRFQLMKSYGFSDKEAKKSLKVMQKMAKKSDSKTACMKAVTAGTETQMKELKDE